MKISKTDAEKLKALEEWALQLHHELGKLYVEARGVVGARRFSLLMTGYQASTRDGNRYGMEPIDIASVLSIIVEKEA